MLLEYLLLLAAGALVGAVLGGFYVKYRMVRQAAAAQLTSQTQIATLKQDLHSTKDQLQALQTDRQHLTCHLEQTQLEKTALTGEIAAMRSQLEACTKLELQLQERQDESARLNELIVDLKQRLTAVETAYSEEQKTAQEKVRLLEKMQTRMADAFKALSASALDENNRSFLQLAETAFGKYLEKARIDFDHRGKALNEVVAPVKDALDRYDRQIQAMERSRENAYGSLQGQLQALVQTQQNLQRETGKLSQALRIPQVRGRWGEITLKRVVELAGMQSRCDFIEQPTRQTSAGVMRPDMVVILPGQRRIIVDAKVPLAAYLEAQDAQNEHQREQLLLAHAKQLQSHVHKLAQKSYWAQFATSPDFVVMFIPGENFFSAALTHHPQLLEDAFDKGVILATPTTLVSLLKTVAYGWRQETAAENARLIGELGKELYGRLAGMAQHMNKLGRSIDRCAQTYNQVVGAMERRVLASARRFSRLGIEGKGTLAQPKPCEFSIRNVTAGSEPVQFEHDAAHHNTDTAHLEDRCKPN